MIFEVVKQQERLSELKEDLRSAFRDASTEPAVLVCYTMPALTPSLPQLVRATTTQAFRERCGRAYYYFATKNGLVRELTPMAHYIQHASKAIARKLYSLNRTANRARLVMQHLRETHNSTRELTVRTNQPRIHATSEIYELVEELSAFLFFARSTLDNLAPLLHSLMGRQFVSFTDYTKYMLNDSRLGSDPEMEDYLAARMEWFAQLRDLRDWATHAGTIDISLHETQNGNLIVSVNHFQAADDLVDNIVGGLKEYLRFFDSHYAAVLEGEAGQAP